MYRPRPAGRRPLSRFTLSSPLPSSRARLRTPVRLGGPLAPAVRKPENALLITVVGEGTGQYGYEGWGRPQVGTVVIIVLIVYLSGAYGSIRKFLP
jgi:hypothetical protein